MPEPLLCYQEEPRGFCCGERVSSAELVFASLCGHETCPSVTWHYHHFMQAREAQEQATKTGGNVRQAVAHLLDVLRNL